MRRPTLLPATAALAALTALVLFGAARALQPPARAAIGAANDAASRSVAVRFYDAVNVAIATGNLAPFEAVVAPDFVDRQGIPGVGADRAGLARYLRALHATSPATSLAVEAIAADGERVIATVAVRGGGGSFAGLSLGQAVPLWGPVDVFGVAGGLIVERWGDPAGLSLIEPLGWVALDDPLPPDQVVSLDRLAVRPHDRLQVELVDETAVLYVESGRIVVSPDPESAAPTGERPAGAIVVLSPPDHYEIRNDGDEPAALVRLTRSHVDAAASSQARSDPAYAAPAPAASSEQAAWPIAGGVATAMPSGAAAVVFGRAVLAPGAALPARLDAGPALLAVEAGALGLEIDGGAAWVRSGVNGAATDSRDATLAAGDGALVPSGVGIVLRNPGDVPLLVLLVALVPAEASGPPA